MKKFLSTLALIFILILHRPAAGADTSRGAIDPANFSTRINNPYFTLTPGTTYTYKSRDAEGTEVNLVTVTNKTRKIMGVTTRVVWDRVTLNGKLIEETYDWYAQDRAGNVWYFGEDSKAYKNGRPVSRKGSWEAGVDGAQPGIVMWAQPQPGKPYRQEYRQGEAEDMGQIVALRQSVVVPAGAYRDCVKTKDWSAIEPASVEYKFYARAAGNVVLELENGGRKRVELVAITRAKK